MTSEKASRADRIFSELNGEPVFEEETAGRPQDRDYVINEYKKVPVTFGFEVEQKNTDVGVSGEGEHRFGHVWEYDLSGPYETQLPGGAQGSMMYPGREVHQFVDSIKRANAEWVWRGEFSGHGCGCHIHFRARTNIEFPYSLRLKPYESWSVTYNTLVETVPFIKPLFAWGQKSGPWAHRNGSRGVDYWAGDTSTRLSTPKVKEKVESPRRISNDKHASVGFHPAHHKPLTIELRTNEAHVSMTYFSGIILNRIIRKCIERGYLSTKLEEIVWYDPDSGRTVTYDMTDYAKRESFMNRFSSMTNKAKDILVRGRYAEDVDNLYDVYNLHIHRIKFVNGRNIPGCPREVEGDTAYTDLFQSIMANYTPTFPPLARQGVFFLHLNNPRENSMDFWDIFKPLGDFRWSNTRREYTEHG